jgi:hypothetical protein
MIHVELPVIGIASTTLAPIEDEGHTVVEGRACINYAEPRQRFPPAFE